MGLSPAQAKTLLDANVVNLAKKVANGETLSPRELALVESAAGVGATDKTYAKNQSELAEILGVNRKTIQRWLKIDGNPGCKADGRCDISAWRSFARGRGHEDCELDQGQLRAENLVLINERLRLEIATLKKENIPTTLVEQWGGEVGAAIRKVVTQLHLSAPSLHGLATVADIEARLKEQEDEILSQLNVLYKHIESLKPAVEEQQHDAEPAG